MPHLSPHVPAGDRIAFAPPRTGTGKVDDMKGLSITAIVLCFCAFAGYAQQQGRAGVFQEFVMDAGDLAGLSGTIKAVQFREAPLRGIQERRGNEFTFKSEGAFATVLFRSRKLAGLCDRLNNAQQFADFVARATVYGVEARAGVLDGHVLLSSVCYDKNCADEDFVLVPAD